MSLTIEETTADDLVDLRRLWNDGRVVRWVGFPGGLGLDADGLREWFERLRSSRHAHHFVIRDPAPEGQAAGEHQRPQPVGRPA